MGAYIIDLTLLLHRVFMTMLVQEPPRILSKDLVNDEIPTYKELLAPRIHGHVREMGHQLTDFEKQIVGPIRESLGPN